MRFFYLYMKISTGAKLIVGILISEIVGGIGGLFTASAIPQWYVGLQKPIGNPPAWVFGPTWVMLYALMGIAAGLVWAKMGSGSRREDKAIRVALGMFGVQLFLNMLWSVIFFGLRSPGWAFVDIALLWVAIAVTLFAFAKVSDSATWLLIPYILWVSFAGYLNYSIWRLNANGNGGRVACTMEAKLCPDGTTVGRTGSRCAFAPCPEYSIDPSWKVATDGAMGISFRYPETLGMTYLRALDWPPQFRVSSEPFSCTEAGSVVARAGKTELRNVGGQTYCVTTRIEGAAGSIYTQYAYAVNKNPQTWIFTATTRATQCGNYPEPQKTVCEREREAFDFDTLMNRVIRTAAVH